MTFIEFVQNKGIRYKDLVRESQDNRHILLEFCYMEDVSDKSVQIFIQEVHNLLKVCFESKELLYETS